MHSKTVGVQSFVINFGWIISLMMLEWVLFPIETEQDQFGGEWTSGCLVKGMLYFGRGGMAGDESKG